MIDAVPQQMNQRVLDLLENSSVGLNLPSRNHEISELAAVAAKISHELRKAFQQRGKGDERQFPGIFQDRSHHACQGSMVLFCEPKKGGELAVQRIRHAAASLQQGSQAGKL